MAVMPRSFDGLTESPASVEQILAAYGREDYWWDRLAIGGATARLESLTVGAHGEVAIRVVQHLGLQQLPGPVAKWIAGELKLEHSETWSPNGNGQVSGQVRVLVSGGLGTCFAKTSLTPAGAGSQLSFNGRVEVKIPLVGGGLEKTIGANLAESIPAVLQFTTQWISDRS